MPYSQCSRNSIVTRTTARRETSTIFLSALSCLSYRQNLERTPHRHGRLAGQFGLIFLIVIPKVLIKLSWNKFRVANKIPNFSGRSTFTALIQLMDSRKEKKQIAYLLCLKYLCKRKSSIRLSGSCKLNLLEKIETPT